MKRRDILSLLPVSLAGMTTCSREELIKKSYFTVWAASDSHIHTDLKYGYESIAEAIKQSEFGGEGGGPGFDWDIMLHLGDLKGSSADGQGLPADKDGVEVVRQFTSAKKHRREQIYNLLGNHDASPDQWWFKKWVSPTGESIGFSRVHADRRPFPIEGTWERYLFRAGNILFLMMGDRNDFDPPIGRGTKSRGYPAGCVTRKTFEWWLDMVEKNPDVNIISCHHHMLKNTTVGSGEHEGIDGKYHGYMADGAPRGSSYLYYIGDEPDAQGFERYLEEHPGAIDMWMGGHTHTEPDDTYGGKSHIEEKWGVTFINVAALSRHHAWYHTTPMSRHLTFEPGSDQVRVRCYLHTSDFAQQGWYDNAERVVQLRYPFRW
ncbi:hypothetical protein ACFL60_02220 [Candidatus Omnitrophota bacterium]